MAGRSETAPACQELPPSVLAAGFEPVFVEAFREMRERFAMPMPLGECKLWRDDDLGSSRLSA